MSKFLGPFDPLLNLHRKDANEGKISGRHVYVAMVLRIQAAKGENALNDVSENVAVNRATNKTSRRVHELGTK